MFIKNGFNSEILYFINNLFKQQQKKVIAVILFLVNGHIILFVGTMTKIEVNITNSLNQTFLVTEEALNCYSSNLYSFHPLWDQIHLYIYAVGPFCIILVSNAFIFKNFLNSGATVNKGYIKINIR